MRPAAKLPSRLNAAADHAIAELIDRPYPRWRSFFGGVMLLIVEVALMAFLGLSIWRLGSAFVLGDYIGLPFIANGLALLTCLLAFGHAGLSACFPKPEVLFRRALESHTQKAWESVIGEMKASLNVFSTQVEALHIEGTRFSQALNDEINRCNIAPGSPSEADNLFGKAANAPVEMAVVAKRRVP